MYFISRLYEKKLDNKLIKLGVEKAYTINSENGTGLYHAHRIDYNQLNL